MRLNNARPCYQRHLIQRREEALDELCLMFDGLWPHASAGLLAEAAVDLQGAERIDEVSAVVAAWSRFLQEYATDPDIEAQRVLLPMFSAWTAERVSR